VTLEEIMEEVALLSDEEQVEFVRLWLPLHKEEFRSAVAEMLRDLERQVNLEFFRNWMKQFGNDSAFLEAVLKAAEKAVVTHGFRSPDDQRRIDWMEETLKKEPEVKPRELGARCVKVHGLDRESTGKYVLLARTVKERRRARLGVRDIRERRKTGAPAPVRAARRSNRKKEEDLTVPSNYDLNDMCRLMEPYMDYLSKNWNMGENLLRAAEFLAENGGCPSIVPHWTQDREARDLRSLPEYRLVLERVSLLDHSYLVTKFALSIAMAQYHGISSVPVALAAGICHDMGKIPYLRGIIGRDDHPVVSADKFRGFFGESRAPWVQEIGRAIERHHKAGPVSMWGDILKKADSMARDEEFTYDFRLGGIIEPRKIESWFTVKDFIEELAQDLNRLYWRRSWLFSHYDTVYCTMEPLRCALRRLAIRKRCFDVRIASSAYSREVLRIVVAELRKAEMIQDALAQNRPGRLFWVHFSDWNDSVEKYMLPLAIEAFNVTIDEAQNMKTGVVRRIKSVESSDGTGA